MACFQAFHPFSVTFMKSSEFNIITPPIKNSLIDNPHPFANFFEMSNVINDVFSKQTG